MKVFIKEDENDCEKKLFLTILLLMTNNSTAVHA